MAAVSSGGAPADRRQPGPPQPPRATGSATAPSPTRSAPGSQRTVRKLLGLLGLACTKVPYQPTESVSLRARVHPCTLTAFVQISLMRRVPLPGHGLLPLRRGVGHIYACSKGGSLSPQGLNLLWRRPRERYTCGVCMMHNAVQFLWCNTQDCLHCRLFRHIDNGGRRDRCWGFVEGLCGVAEGFLGRCREIASGWDSGCCRE
jgi:hypothetical protein